MVCGIVEVVPCLFLVHTLISSETATVLLLFLLPSQFIRGASGEQYSLRKSPGKQRVF